MPKIVRTKKTRTPLIKDNLKIIENAKYYFLGVLGVCNTRVFFNRVVKEHSWNKVSLFVPSNAQVESGCDMCPFQHHSNRNAQCAATNHGKKREMPNKRVLYSPVDRKPFAQILMRNLVFKAHRKRGSAYLFVEKLYKK